MTHRTCSSWFVEIARGCGLVGVGVVVAVLVGVEDGGDGSKGGVGDLDPDGGLPVGGVPQDLQVEGLEQEGFELGGEPGQRVAGERELVEQADVSGTRRDTAE